MCVWFTKEIRRVPLLQEKLFTRTSGAFEFIGIFVGSYCSFFSLLCNIVGSLIVFVLYSLVYCVILWGSLIVFVLYSLVYCVILWGSLIVFFRFLLAIILFVLQTFFMPKVRKVRNWKLIVGYLPKSHSSWTCLVYCVICPPLTPPGHL